VFALFNNPKLSRAGLNNAARECRLTAPTDIGSGSLSGHAIIDYFFGRLKTY
jgi:hypothetical protein